MSDSCSSSDIDAALGPQRELRKRFEVFRESLDRRDQVVSQSVLFEFEAALHRRIAIERRLLLPVLPSSGTTKRSPRAELEIQFDQLRDLTRHIRAELAAGADRAATRGELLGFVANLARRLDAHASEMERIYYPAAWPALKESDRSALAHDALAQGASPTATEG